MLDFELKDFDNDFAEYFDEFCIITKTSEETQMAKVNQACKMYYGTLDQQEYQQAEKLL